MKKSKLALTILLVLMLTALSNEICAQDQPYEYVYVSVNGKSFSKRLKVKVDFGDREEEINKGKDYSKLLSDKKSYVGILNYMVENEFELVESFVNYSTVGSDDTAGIVFLMRKKK